MSDRVAIALRLPSELADAVQARADELGVSRHETIVQLLREGLDHVPQIESAVETVVGYLAGHEREDLAAAVAVATDPAPPEERAEVRLAIRRWWLDRPTSRRHGHNPPPSPERPAT